MKTFICLLLSTVLALSFAGCGTEDTCSGANTCVCESDQSCDKTCEAGAACRVDCSGAASCGVDCASASTCSVSCQSSQSCEVACPPEGCSVTCPSTGCTVTNCSDPAVCRVTCGTAIGQVAVYSGGSATCR